MSYLNKKQYCIELHNMSQKLRHENITHNTSMHIIEKHSRTFNQTGIKVSKTAKIRKRYNQVPHLTQDTTWERNKTTINITDKNQEVSPFPAGDNTAAMNRRESRRNTRHKKHKYSIKEVTALERSVIFHWRT